MEDCYNENKYLITKIKRLEKELDYYKTFIENFNIVVQVSRIEDNGLSNIIWGNNTHIWIENLKLDNQVLCNPKEKNIMDFIIKRAQEKKKEFSFFYRHTNKQGEKKWIASFCMPFKYSESGKLLEMIITSIEFSEHLFSLECYSTMIKDLNYLNNKHIINKLTKTELEIIKLMGQGKKEKEIAEIRTRSLHTIKTHIKNIRKKLNISKNTELVKFAVNNGLA